VPLYYIFAFAWALEVYVWYTQLPIFLLDNPLHEFSIQYSITHLEGKLYRYHAYPQLHDAAQQN
jgi:hypothetical protein